jgi:AcrR family transcriptional regulator
MRAVGARVGLTASALYAYFPGKLDLMRALWRDALGQLHHRLDLISLQEADPIKAIRGLAMAYADFALENPVRFRVLFMLDLGELEKELGADQDTQNAYQVVYLRVAEAMDQGRLRLGDPALAAQTLWAGIHGVLILIHSCPSFPFLPPSQLVAAMTETLLAGLLAETPRE